MTEIDLLDKDLKGYLEADYTICHVMGRNREIEALASYTHDVSNKISEHVNKGMVVADVFRCGRDFLKPLNSRRLYLLGRKP